MWPHCNIFCFSFYPIENLPQVFTVGYQTVHKYFINHGGLIKLAPILADRAVYFMILNASNLLSLLWNTQYRCSCFENLMLIISPTPCVDISAQIWGYGPYCRNEGGYGDALLMSNLHFKTSKINRPFKNLMILTFNLCWCCLLAAVK